MTREAKLLKNVIVLGIGVLGSRFLGVMLLPLYTFYFTKEQYGIYDIATTTIALAIPLISMKIADAVYRNVIIEREINYKKVYISNAFFLCLSSSLVSAILLFVVSFIFDWNFVFLIFIMLITMILYDLFLQSLRALSLNKQFTLCSVYQVLISVLANVIFVVVLKYGIEALFIASIIGNVFGIGYILIRARMYRYISVKAIDISTLKKMLSYSVPLIPNSLMWWIMNLSDRYLIGFYWGIGASGIFAVSNKFTSIIIIANFIFSMAWQESAIKEYSSEDRDIYYTSMFNKLVGLMFSTVIVLISFSKIVFNFAISSNFEEAIQYIPILFSAAILSSFSNFFSTGYILTMKTRGVFTSSLAGAMVKIGLGILLVPIGGLKMAAFSTTAAFATICTIRFIQTKKNLTIKIDYKQAVIWSSLYITFAFFYYLQNKNIEILMAVSSIFIFILYNRNLIKQLILKVLKNNKLKMERID